MAIILRTLRKRPTAPLGQRGAPAGPLGVGGHVLPLSFRFGTVFCAIESQTRGDSAQPRQAANTTRCLVTALKPQAGARRPRAKFWSWGGSARGREAFPFRDTLLRPQRGAVKSLRWSPRDAWCPRVHKRKPWLCCQWPASPPQSHLVSGQRHRPGDPGSKGTRHRDAPHALPHSAPGVCEGDGSTPQSTHWREPDLGPRALGELGRSWEKPQRKHQVWGQAYSLLV